MTRFSFSSAFPLGDEKKYASELPGFLKNIVQNSDQGFFTDEVLKNTDLFDQIDTFAQRVKGKYSFVVVLGIGGSALGISAIKNAIPSKNAPEFFVADNIDPEFLQEIEDAIEYEKTLFLVISKSGTTTETLAEHLYFKHQVLEKGLKEKDHFVFITDPHNGILREQSEKKGITSFPIPQNVGGRFSVLTAVGMVPAALMGLNITSFMEGALAMREKFFSENYEENIPFQLASAQMFHRAQQRTQTVFYSYSARLLTLVDWYRQLLAESTGKQKNRQDENIFTGFTPINALGVTDHHSQNQLYMEGPDDKFFIFLSVKNLLDNKKIPVDDLEQKNEKIAYLKDKSFLDVLNAEKEGCKQSLVEYGRFFADIELEEKTEYSLGELFFLLQASVAFLGEFLNINAFDQPGVELCKVLTQNKLKKI